uniref:Uncharacterized protein n=1 Tax=Podarcis muralis TaxID=64176 RepID=A0A670IIW7_PODMU
MDLFGDLPEAAPSAAVEAAAGKEGQKGILLFDELPSVSSTDFGMILIYIMSFTD